ncbi:MAG: aldehyde dehydrogenase family protein [Marinibacterium sp.]|nr:aldehyde dehydrogenase family protein [Marinibacterium sp.]
MQTENRYYVNGAWVTPEEPNLHPVIDPSTEEVIARIHLSNEAETDQAVQAARAALPGWMYCDPAERVAFLERLLEIYQRRAAEMGQAMSAEMGTPITMSNMLQVGIGTRHIEGFIDAARAFAFEQVHHPDHPDNYIIKEAAGVAALITPWNLPMNQVTLKVGAAIAAGCTMVLKPSEESPLSALLFAEMMDEAGAPPGVFNLINGTGAVVGNCLSGHPDVDVISFTGSTRAGRQIMQNAAGTLKTVHLELGGKGANLVFADADAEAVERGVKRMMLLTGQMCNAPSRMIVEKGFYDEAVQIAAKVAQAVDVGPASAEGGHIGPVVNERQFNAIQTMIQRGIDDGARLVAGGPGRADGFNAGYYVRPTVFADVTPDMAIYREEIFGPVLTISSFEDESDAIAMANDTVYGLTNYVQTSDTDKRRRVARRLRSGMVDMNGANRAPGMPFGGMKQSGNAREGGAYGIEDFLEVKAVAGW